MDVWMIFIAVIYTKVCMYYSKHYWTMREDVS